MRWIDTLGRSRRRRLPGVRDALDARLLQPGLEGRRRRHPARRRLARAAAARPVRAAGLRLRRQAADGRHLRDPRPDRARAPGCGPRRADAVRPLQRRVLVGGRGHVLPRARRRQAADRDRGLERRALPGQRDRPAGSGGPGRRAPDGRTTCGPAGGSGRCRRTTPRTTRSATTRARSGRTTTR